MNLLKKAAFGYVAPLLGALSLATAPLEVEAQGCCEPSPCCIDWCSMLVPALVGAAAGAGTAAAINNKGKHGKHGEKGDRGEPGQRGEQGPEGANPFLRDVEHSLTFNWEIESISFECEIAGSIIPFVSTPDGHVLTAESFDIIETSNASDTSLTLSSPVYGTNTFGLEIPPHECPLTIVYNFHVSPTDGRGTTDFSGEITFPPNEQQIQFSFDYTYGTIGTVPVAIP